MFTKFIARPAGLLAGLLLATSSHAAVVNFNFVSSEFTLKTTINFDNTVDAAFGTTTGLTINEFTTTLGGSFVLPVLKYLWVASDGLIRFSGGSSSSMDSGMDDVMFSYNPLETPIIWYQRASETTVSTVANVSFNQDAYSSPTTNGVPEPSSLALVALAGLGVVGARRRRA